MIAVTSPICTEIDAQRERLAGIVEDDTHVLLHLELPAMIPWPAVLKQPAVRLIVPLRVVKELDDRSTHEATTSPKEPAGSSRSSRAPRIGRQARRRTRRRDD